MDENNEDDGDFIEDFTKRLRSSRKNLSTWEVTAKQCYGFVSGDHWSEEDKAYMEEQLRPLVTFNRIAPLVEAVCGTEVSNRQEVRFIPRGNEDTGFAELITSAGKWIRDQCDAEDEESNSFRDTVICGYGWTETRIDYDDEQDGKIFVERVDPFEMDYDPSAKKANLSDARWVCNSRWIPKEDAAELWPDAAFSTVPTESGKPTGHVATDAWKYKNNAANSDHEGEVLIHQYQYWEKKPFYRVQDPSGQIVELPQERFDLVKEQLDAQGIRYVRQSKKVYSRCFISGNEVLEKTPCPAKKSFTFKCITGKRDQLQGTYYGIVNAMIDPQQWANKFFSQILHIINSNAKGGVMAEASAFVNPKKAEAEWAQPTSITLLKEGGLNKVAPKPSVQYPQGLDQMMGFAITSIRDVAGINLEQLGMANRQQAGVLEDMRKQAGLTILASLFDSLRRYRKEQGRLLVDFMSYISDGRLIRITDQGQSKYIPLLRGPEGVEYDIIVDESPTTPNYKERIWSVLGQLVPQLIGAGLPIPPDILDYSPLPEALVMKWKQMLVPDPSKQQAQQLEQAQKSADVQETQSKVALNQAKVQEIGASVQQNHMDSQMQHYDNTMQHPINAMNAETDRIHALNDQHRAATDPIIEMMKTLHKPSAPN